MLLLLPAVVTLIATLSSMVNGGNVSTMHVMFFSSSADRFNSTGAMAAASIAAQRINSSGVLPGHEIKLIFRDSECDGATSVRQFLTQVQLPSPTIIGVIGCGCSVATEPVADITPLYGIPLISYTSSSVGLTRPSNGLMMTSSSSSCSSSSCAPSGYYQVFPSDSTVPVAIAAILREYNWSQMSVITEKEDVFLQVEDQLISILNDDNRTVINPAHFLTVDQQLNSRENGNALAGNTSLIFTGDARIFFINAFEDKARQLLCEGFRERIPVLYPNFTWILYGWYSEEWWRSPDPAVNCSADELASVLERAIVVQQYPIAGGSDTPVGGVVDELNNSNFIETLAYDSVWTLALALNRTMNMIDNNDTVNCGPSPDPLEEFSYTSNSTSCLIRHTLSNTNFTGQSGQVQFSNAGIRIQTTVSVLQYRNDNGGLKLHKFAEINVLKENATLEYLARENRSTVWPVTTPPDGKPLKVINSIHIIAVAIVYVVSCAGIVFAFVCLFFNIIFRERKVVRLTSPNINYIIIIGALFLYASCLISVLPTNSLVIWDGVCKTIAILQCFGFTLTFGPIMAKLGRIYHIFHNPTLNKKKVSDWHLLLVILGVFAVGVILLVIGYSIPACIPRSHLQNDESQPPSRDERGIRTTFCIISCFPDECDPWVFVLFIYFGILLIIALILALLTRTVKIRVLNEAKEMTLIMYITSILTVEMLIYAIFLGRLNSLQEGLFNTHLALATTVILSFLFVPKMVALYKDPKGENIFSQTQPQGSTAGWESAIDKGKIQQLERRLTRLQSKLKEKNIDENDIINDDLLSPGPQQAVTEITVTAVEKKNQTNSDSMDNNNSNCTQLQRVTFFATDNEINTKL